MKAIIALLAVVVLAAGLSKRSVSARVTTGCLATDDNTTAIHTGLRKLGDDAELAAMRTTLGLTAVPDSLVQLVTNDSICVEAAAAYTSQRNDGVSDREVWVFSFGSDHYAVMDPDAMIGEFTDMKLFTRQFVHVHTIAW